MDKETTNTTINTSTAPGLTSNTVSLVASKKPVEEIDEAYSSEPWWYDLRGLFILTFAYRTNIVSQLRFFSKDIGPNHLEVAVGTGTLFEMVLKWRRLHKMPTIHAIAFDYAERMLNGARKRFKNDKQVTLLRADVTNLALPSDQFDTATIANAIHCLPDVKSGLQEIHRVLKKQGQLVGNCLLEPKGDGFFDRFARRINRWGIKKGILIRPFQASEIQDLLNETGFVVDRYEITGNCLNFVASKVDLK